MIFDWEKAVKTIVSDKKYFKEDRFEKKTEYRQQIYLCSYLITLGKTKEEILNFWKTIPNNNLLSCVDDIDIQMCFDHLYSQAINNVETFKKYLNRKSDIKIYQSEIDCINKLQGGLEFRKYILVILAIVKYYKIIFGSCDLNTSLRSYAFELASGKEYHKYSQSLFKKNRENNSVIVTKIKTTGHSKMTCDTSLSFLQTKGNISIQISDPSEVSKFFNRINYPISTCSKCGCTYEQKPKSKTTMCPQCYEQHRKNRKKISAQKQKTLDK